MSATHTPYVPADQNVAELTVRAIVLGIILGALMTAANTYLGLYMGMTVSASIPAAVMSMLLLRLLKFKDVTILENNVVQTMTSAGESLAAGIIFTMPALLVMGFAGDMNFVTVFCVAILGGVLGTIFTIALRRVFIVEEALLYPEGIACEEVLVAGEKGGSSLIVILYALGLGAIYGWFVKGFEIAEGKIMAGVDIIGARIYVASDLSLALLSVGYIVGLRIASYIFTGALLGVLLITPVYGLVHGWPSGGLDVAHSAHYLWISHVRFVGVGCMVVGGLWTLWSMRKTITTGVKRVFGADLAEEQEGLLRTEKDLPMKKMMPVLIGIVILTFFFYTWRLNVKGASLTEAAILGAVGSLFLAMTAFFFSAVAGYIAGVVGSSNSPVSGMTIATLMGTALLVWIVGDLFLGMEQNELMYATLIIASVVAVNAAIAGDVMQDLKTGHLVGATPWKQQIAEVIGVITGAVMAPLTLVVLNDAYRLTKTYCLENPIKYYADGSPNCSSALDAPQAEIIGTLIEGIFGGTVNYPMLGLGVLIAVIIIWKGLPVMSVAIGMYLPFYLSATIFTGGLLSHFVLRTVHLRVDGSLSGEPTEEAVEAGTEVSKRGLLLSAGMIAGEALMGVVVAIFIVMANLIKPIRPPAEWFCSDSYVDAGSGHSMCDERVIGTLPTWLSLLFFIWFFLVFTYLATRGMPKSQNGRGNILVDWIAITIDGIRRFVNSLKPPSMR
ncbi:MAG: oligopeptide transporter, OPT family [Marine Group II euryarchaeote MED-G33]|nr:MAG: oligopeptide transporter, OPT family [Marine Group II euryarchaeote MED-G33]|tara:strand:- start:12915 stop:15092 length:2178 start_codon:yes stop_codon:yes gene_type:complete